MKQIQVGCEMEVTLKMIGGKYKPLILELLIRQGTCRFNQLLRQISQVSRRTLANSLRELAENGLTRRMVYAWVPPKAEYDIVKSGRYLENILKLMCRWGAGTYG